MIIFLEGPDGVGKTTAAKNFAKINAKYKYYSYPDKSDSNSVSRILRYKKWGWIGGLEALVDNKALIELSQDNMSNKQQFNKLLNLTMQGEYRLACSLGFAFMINMMETAGLQPEWLPDRQKYSSIFDRSPLSLSGFQYSKWRPELSEVIFKYFESFTAPVVQVLMSSKQNLEQRLQHRAYDISEKFSEIHRMDFDSEFEKQYQTLNLSKNNLKIFQGNNGKGYKIIRFFSGLKEYLQFMSLKIEDCDLEKTITELVQKSFLMTP